MVAADRGGGEASVGEAVVEVVERLDRDLVEAGLAEGHVAGDTSSDGAVALDGAGTSAAGLEVIDVGAQQFVDGVASGGPVPIEFGRERREQLLSLPLAATNGAADISRAPCDGIAPCVGTNFPIVRLTFESDAATT